MHTYERQRSPQPDPAIAQTDSLSVFRSIVDSSFVPLRVSAHTHRAFSARLTTAQADSVAFTEISARPHLVERTPDTIVSGGSGYYKVNLLLQGSSILVQDGKELVMRPGDLTVYDTSRPYSLVFDEDMSVLIMMFPKDKLDLPAALTEQLTAVSLGQEHASLAPIITSFLGQFPSGLANLDRRVRSKLAHTSLDLLGTLFASILDADASERDPRQLLLQHVYAYIDAHLSDPALSPGEIAAAHYISTRHLHSLFKLVGTTVSTWIRERRLERCRMDLLNPALASRPISTIATQWGFVDPAHFSRVFRNAYGVSPSEARYRG